MTQKDGMAREVGGGVQDGKHVYTRGRFILLYGKTNTASNKINKFILKKEGKNTQKNYTENVLMTQITTMV